MGDVLLTNRKVIRQALHPLVQNAMTGLVPAENIKRSRLADPHGQTPLIYVTSGASERPPLTVRQKQATFTIVVFSLVLLQDPQNELWTEELAEDLLDDVEARIKKVVEDNPKREMLWTSLEYDEGGTLIERLPFAGNDYLVETIPLNFRNSF